MATTSITIRMDETLKRMAERTFEDMGMNMTTAFTIFAKAVVREGRIPFEVKSDMFWCEENQRRLLNTIARHEAGEEKAVQKTMEQLEEMEHG